MKPPYEVTQRADAGCFVNRRRHYARHNKERSKFPKETSRSDPIGPFWKSFFFFFLPSFIEEFALKPQL